MTSKLLLPALLAMLAVLVPACAPPDEVISSAQAREPMQALHPAPSADAVPNGEVHEYY